MNKTKRIIIIVVFFLPIALFSQQDIDSLKIFADRIRAHPEVFSHYANYWKTKFRLCDNLEKLKKACNEFETQFVEVQKKISNNDSLQITRAWIYREYLDNVQKAFYNRMLNSNRDKKSNISGVLWETFQQERYYANMHFIKTCESTPENKRGEHLNKLYFTTKRIFGQRQFYEDLKDKPVPDFNFKTVFGDTNKLSGLRDSYLLLHFWHTECNPCLQDIINLQNAFNQYKNKGFNILSINGNQIKRKWDRDVVKNAINELGMTWLHIFDGNKREIHNLFYLSNWPWYFLIDKNGYLIERGGELQGDKLFVTLKNIFTLK